MAVRRIKQNSDHTHAAFARCWDSVSKRWTSGMARQILRLQFGETELQRMHELAERNSEGDLSAAEQDELEGYVRAGDTIAILQSAARRRLKSLVAGANGHG